MARKKKNANLLSYLPDLEGKDWLAMWSQRVGYIPPPATPRGQGRRPVSMEGVGTVMADPTRFTSTGPSKKTAKRRISRNPARW